MNYLVNEVSATIHLLRIHVKEEHTHTLSPLHVHLSHGSPNPLTYWLQVLVDSLANSKTFQRFAIRSNAMFADMAKKSNVHHANVTEKSAEFLKVFREELTKGVSDMHKGGRP